MLKRTLLLLPVVAMLALPVSTLAQDNAGSPKLVIPEKIIDFGVVPKGEMIVAKIKLVNEGDAALKVKTVRPTCGCTVADFPDTIAARGEGFITAKLDTMDFSGPINKALLLMTDDPETPSVSLVLKAVVQPFIEVLPKPLVRFNAIQTENATEKVYLVADTDEGKNFKILKIVSEAPYITTKWRELSKEEKVDQRDGKQYEISLSLTDDAPPGSINAKIMVHTDHPKAKQVIIKTFGVVRALLHVTPSRLQFGVVEAGMKPGRNVVIVNNRPQGMVEITSAEIDDPAFKTEIFTLEKGKRFQVAVSIDPAADPGQRDATLTLKTTDEDFPELTIPIRAAIR
jgi:hypothetical protein